MTEPFLIQMDDFDRFLEFELRQLLDPVVDTAAPPWRRRKRTGSPFLAVISAPLEMAAEVLPAGEPVVVPVQPFRVVN
ncbi:MAG: hypothetical protein NVS1B3_11760 [Candidatus Dormibacteraceae bacterium]